VAISEVTAYIQTWKKPKHNNLNKKERSMLKQIRDTNNIIIVQADKGGKVVVMEKEEYNEKIEQKLNDGTYQQTKDPTNQIKKELAEITDKLHKQNKITIMDKLKMNGNEYTSEDQRAAKGPQRWTPNETYNVFPRNDLIISVTIYL